MPPFRSKTHGHVFRAQAPWDKKPQTVMDAHVRVFDLSAGQDVSDFTRVMQMVGMAPPAAYIHTLDKQFCADTGSWKVFLIWYALYSEMPDETRVRYDAFLRGEECL